MGCQLRFKLTISFIIMQYNMSPETIIEGKGVTLTFNHCLIRNYLRRYGKSIGGNGQVFRTDKKGIYLDIIDGMYTERVGIKRQMLDAQQALQKLTRLISKLYTVSNVILPLLKTDKCLLRFF